MGAGAGPALQSFGLPPALQSPLPLWAQDLPLPLGLLTADHIVTVSPTYAKEILTPEYGSGLEGFLQSRADSISGILNGINVEEWDPALDSTLAAQFNRDNLTARALNKGGLLRELGLHETSLALPLLGIISRIEAQKGIDLVPGALRLIDDLPWQAIILGTGEPELEAAIERLADRYPGRVKAAFRFDPLLSHHIYAGADCLLIPSRYEPCGLTQMIAMRYGCVPVARATGGLIDTIQDFDFSEHGTGFLFKRPTVEVFSGALRRALEVYQKQNAWRRIQQDGMAQDFSWERSARQYLKLYLFMNRKKESDLRIKNPNERENYEN
jgi:starch synthase